MVRSAPRAGGGASHLVQGRDAQEPQVGPQGGLGSARQTQRPQRSNPNKKDRAERSF